MDVEHLCMGVYVGIPVGRGKHRRDTRTSRNLDVSELRVPGCDPGREEHWRLVAETLLNGLRYQRSVTTECVKLIGMSQQKVEEVPAGTVCGLDSGRKEHPEEGEDLVVIELLSI